MKNSEKTITIADYYVDLITRLSDGKDNFIITTVDIANEIESLDKELGVKCASKKAEGVRLCLMRQKFAKYFEDYIKETVLDDTYKGPGSRKIFNIELKPEDRAGLVLKIQNKYKCTKMIYKIPGKEVVKAVEKSAVITTPKPKVELEKIKKAKSIIPGKYLPRRDWLKKFYNLCVLAKSDKDNNVSKKQIQAIMGLKSVPGIGKLITEWKGTLIRGGMTVKMSQYIALNKERLIKIEDPNSAIMTISENYKKWFGEDLGAEDLLHTKTSFKITKEVESISKINKVDSRLPYLKAYTIFAIAGIVKKFDGKTVDFVHIGESLRDNFNIDLSKTDIINIIKDCASSYFNVNTHCGIAGISLKADISWEDFCKEFSPRNYKKTVIARIGMTEEEVSRLMSNNKVRLLSRISENDAIYEITVDKSIHSLKEISNLYRTFRGTDQIFDEELVKKIENELVYSDSRAYNEKNYIPYSIEL